MRPAAKGDERPGRIAILGSRGIPARYGGFETFAERLAIGLAQRGHQVTVYAEGEGADESYRGVTVRYISSPEWGAFGTIAYDVFSLWDARRGHDVVYMLGYGAAFACAVPRWFGSTVWINIDGLEWRRSKWSWVARTYLRCMEWIASMAADVVVADARAIAMHYEQAYPAGAPCVFIPYGADSPSPLKSGRDVLTSLALSDTSYDLLIARLEPENHVLPVIQAHACLNSDIALVIVGDHTCDTPYVRELLRQVHPRILWLGAIFDHDLLGALRTHCRIYLHGHSVGGTNPSLLEAMAAGCAVIAHNNPFNQEVLSDAGLYFSDSSELTTVLNGVDGLDLPRFRVVARKRVADVYSWDAVINQYEPLLQKAAML